MKRKTLKKPGKYIAVLLLFAVSLVSLYPFYMMLIMSTYRAEEIFTGIRLLPGNYFGVNLNAVLTSNFAQAYANSILVSVCATIVSVLISAMAGYALNIYRFRFRNVIFRIILLTMMIPCQISLVGYMIEMRTLHFTNTLLPLMFTWFASGFGVFWMTQYISGALSREMVESARIDGCHELLVFFRIVIPCILPAVTTLVLLVFLWSWNNYLLPLIFINRANLSTIPIYIQSLRNAFRTDYGAQLTGLVLTTAPLIALFVMGSRSFIKGLTAGSVKG
jgi:multiple sugar transport system permease protein/cellobiose transport system permease protein